VWKWRSPEGCRGRRRALFDRARKRFFRPARDEQPLVQRRPRQPRQTADLGALPRSQGRRPSMDLSARHCRDHGPPDRKRGSVPALEVFHMDGHWDPDGTAMARSAEPAASPTLGRPPFPGGRSYWPRPS
jgi:hypothetical protein